MNKKNALIPLSVSYEYDLVSHFLVVLEGRQH
jgi:hypothetical protein